MYGEGKSRVLLSSPYFLSVFYKMQDFMQKVSFCLIFIFGKAKINTLMTV